MTDYLGYILIRILSFIFCLLPVEAALFIGRRIGDLVYVFNKKRRAIAYANLRSAFSKEKRPAELRKIVRGVYRNLGQVFVEVMRFPVVDKKYLRKYITLNGVDVLEAARAKNNGVMILTAHYGNWELGGLIGGLMGLPLSVLAREQGHNRLNELLNKYRELAGCKVISKGFATRQIFKALKSNGVVAILTDQDAGRLGTFVDFFGRPTSTHNGAFVFARKTGAPLMPVLITRENGPYQKVDFLEPIKLKDTGDEAADIASGLQEFSALLESYVRKYPEQWLWVHKRWKSTPQRSILILNDGKAGHLNQSIAVAEIIKRYRQDKGYRAEHTRYEVIDVKYKNRFRRALVLACSYFPSFCGGTCMNMLKFALEEGSYQRLAGSYADIVISCGSSLAPVNVILKKENNAKNIVIMKPSLTGLKKFNLAIVPRHDRPGKADNILETAGSPNRINEEAVKEASAGLASAYNISGGRPRIGVLLGGDTADYKMGHEQISGIIRQVKAVSEKRGLDIMLTTSRRTPPDIEKLLKEELFGSGACRLLVIANEKNIEGAVQGILGLSSVIVISGESISMVSEAASASPDKQVLVFPLVSRGAGGGMGRHRRMVARLEEKGFIKMVARDGVGAAIETALDTKVQRKQLNDNENIYNSIGRLI